jgi:hypothetical protein
VPLDDPQAPLTAGKTALQLAVVPPFTPVHDQFHGPLPETAVAVPVVQSPVEGAEVSATPLDDPHAPLTGVAVTPFCAVHDAVVPPFDPVHVQFHGPVPSTVVAVPVEQRPVVGVEVNVAPLDPPHTPVTGCGAVASVPTR